MLLDANMCVVHWLPMSHVTMFYSLLHTRLSIQRRFQNHKYTHICMCIAHTLRVHLFLFYSKTHMSKYIFKYSTNFEAFFFLITNSLLQLVHLKSTLVPEPWALPHELTYPKIWIFTSWDNPSIILDQYLGGEQLQDPILQKGIFSTKIFHKGPHKLMSLKMISK